MNEEEVISQLKDAGADLVVSLPCDRNKRLTDMLHLEFEVVDVTREEDAVGICAGACLMGRRPVISIQSSGIGNMMNAMMSLTSCYGLPLFILASWRGTESEKIEAQIPFNSKVPELLKVYGIGCDIVEREEDIHLIGDAVERSFSNNSMNVILVKPELWCGSQRLETDYPPRSREAVRIDVPAMTEPSLTRLEAIGAVMSTIEDDDIVVSNIGVPSKEVYASRDRPLNFYMLGSYTQATPIGVGMALSTDRDVVVIDGDGSLLGSSVLPVLSALNLPNLKVVCLDNGTYGSTGNQMNQAYSFVDMYAVAKGYGLKDVARASTGHEIENSVLRGDRFIHVPIKAFNSASPNIPLSAVEIRDRFKASL